MGGSRPHACRVCWPQALGDSVVPCESQQGSRIKAVGHNGTEPWHTVGTRAKSEIVETKDGDRRTTPVRTTQAKNLRPRGWVCEASRKTLAGRERFCLPPTIAYCTVVQGNRCRAHSTSPVYDYDYDYTEQPDITCHACKTRTLPPFSRATQSSFTTGSPQHPAPRTLMMDPGMQSCPG